VLVRFELDGQGPLVEQLVKSLKQGIRAGRFPVDAFLPSTRALAVTLGLSRNTVLAAYELLCGEPLLSLLAIKSPSPRPTTVEGEAQCASFVLPIASI
jgi:GntR family transcriptional regulator / MocR family aminotransferase